MGGAESPSQETVETFTEGGTQDPTGDEQTPADSDEGEQDYWWGKGN
jgi:hypothetical protein